MIDTPHAPDSGSEITIYYLMCHISEFILQFFGKSDLVQKVDFLHVFLKQPTWTTRGFWLLWLWPLLRKGARQPLQEADIYECHGYLYSSKDDEYILVYSRRSAAGSARTKVTRFHKRKCRCRSWLIILCQIHPKTLYLAPFLCLQKNKCWYLRCSCNIKHKTSPKHRYLQCFLMNA